MENKILENEINETELPKEEIAEEVLTEEETNSIEAEVKEEVAEAPAETASEESDFIEPLRVSEIPESPEFVAEAQTAPAASEDENTSFFKTAKWQRTWDKITTGLLIAVMAVPVAILAYILLWFILK